MKISRDFLLGILVLAADQWSKKSAMDAGMVTINRGGALGIQFSGFASRLLDWNQVLTAVSIILLVWIFKQMKKWGDQERNWGYLIIFAGVSNIIDRVIWGGVRDWVELPFFGMKNNLADMFLTASIIGLLITVYNLQRAEKLEDELARNKSTRLK